MHVSCIFMQLKGPLDRHTHSNTHTVTHTKSHTHRHWLWQNISLHGRCLCFALNCKPQRHLLEGGQARERVRVWECSWGGGRWAAIAHTQLTAKSETESPKMLSSLLRWLRGFALSLSLTLSLSLSANFSGCDF